MNIRVSAACSPRALSDPSPRLVISVPALAFAMVERTDPEVTRARMAEARANLPAIAEKNRQKAAAAKQLHEEAVAAAAAAKASGMQTAKAVGKSLAKPPPPPVPSYRAGLASRAPTPPKKPTTPASSAPRVNPEGDSTSGFESHFNCICWTLRGCVPGDG